MKERLLKTKNELEKEYKSNEKEIKNFKEKIKILESNIIEGKFNIFGTMTAVSFVVGIIGTVICGFVAPELIVGTGFEVVNLFKNLFIGSFISGFILERIVSKINNKKLNRFSSAKTEEQKREELFEYELEVEKLNDKNHAINRAYEFVCDIETNLSVCRPDFGNSDMSKEEQQVNNKKLKETIDTKERELEISTTQEFISDKFFMSRSKMGKLATIGIPILTGIFVSGFAFIGTVTFSPVMYMEATPAVTNLLKNISLSSGLLGTSVSSVATFLRRKQDKRIFDKINNRLGENKLPSNINSYFGEHNTIIDKSRLKIDSLASTYLAYQDSKRELERFANDDNIGGENPVEIAIRGAKDFDNRFDLRSEPDERMILLEEVAHEDKPKEAEGPTLLKRK